jgi:glutamate racemase
MKSNSKRPIGIFDSGVGGLTVFSTIARMLPHEDLIYFGDTARVPYGNKSAETIQRYSLQIARFLEQKKIKMLVVACNTASAYGLPLLQRTFDFPVSGVIVAGVRAALNRTQNGRIAVIGTTGTIKSGSYRKALMHDHQRWYQGAEPLRYFGQACPLFVPLVEEGWLKGAVTEQVAQQYLRFVNTNACDTLILGCTHYPLLKQVITKIVGTRIAIVDSAEETAKTVRAILQEKNLANASKKPGNQLFYVSDLTEKFYTIGKLCLKKNLTRVQRVQWD